MLTIVSRSLLIAGGLVASRCEGAESSTKIINREFGFSAKFPEKTVVCQSYSGNHLQGYYVSLDSSKICTNYKYKHSNAVRNISIVASFNSSFYQGLESITPSGCRPIQQNEERRLSLRQLRMDGEPVIRCVTPNRNGGITITVATRFGRSQFSEGREAKAKRVNLLVNLRTNPLYAQRDIRAFRRVVESIRLR